MCSPQKHQSIMKVFKSYKKEKFSSDPSYRDLPLYGRLCKVCGYPWGKHHGYITNRCPSTEGDFIVSPIDFPREFHPKKLNKNTKVL
jgi:hypothetical protein